MDPLWLEYAHVLGAILIFGTGLGTAFHMWCAHLTGEPRVVAAVGRSTVWADWLFTAPAVALQPVTGALLAWSLGWSLLEPWILVSLGLYVLTGLCWLPVVWLQMEMRRLAAVASREGVPLPARYRRLARIWFALGWPAFVAMFAITWLMIFTPTF
jgi:uncharacterized membrane protein